MLVLIGELDLLAQGEQASGKEDAQDARDAYNQPHVDPQEVGSKVAQMFSNMEEHLAITTRTFNGLDLLDLRLIQAVIVVVILDLHAAIWRMMIFSQYIAIRLCLTDKMALAT